MFSRSLFYFAALGCAAVPFMGDMRTDSGTGFSGSKRRHGDTFACRRTSPKWMKNGRVKRRRK